MPDDCVSTVEAAVAAVEELRDAFAEADAAAALSTAATATATAAAAAMATATAAAAAATPESAPATVEEPSGSAGDSGAHQVKRWRSNNVRDLLFFFEMLLDKIARARAAEAASGDSADVQAAGTKRLLPSDPEAKRLYRERVRQSGEKMRRAAHGDAE